MSDSSSKPSTPKKRKRVNVRRPDVMTLVQNEVEQHYRSSIVEKILGQGGELTIGNTTIRLAKKFGFCYGVERAIDLAYATRKVFPDQRIFLIGEIIHNPEVNKQLRDMGIVSLPWKRMGEEYNDLNEEDVVIVPAFGAPTSFMDRLAEIGCHVIDTTCGDVMKVWRRVRDYAKKQVTSIIHGKADHEETRATASRALGSDNNGHYLIILTTKDADEVCDYIRGNGDRQAFLDKFADAYSPGFDPDIHLSQVGVANQTTMLQSETEDLQQRIRQAVIDRDGHQENYHVFDTICGATQERQNALFGMLDSKDKPPMDLLLVVGGYNSSNTTHLAEIGQENLPTFFIRNAKCMESLEHILHYDLEHKAEVKSDYPDFLLKDKPVIIGVTAGASCPNNLIESTIVRTLEMRGVKL
ncbi:4-hydroxy-3-methylbut-2-enyl diphosphate reductase [Verrucomicrobiaceae bacterium N1E253]|uniref:4-hydroxy-3-methylbut-2-enyl diphosphate reductase n=1 Tax=Oceaniferula marina TaxID=2748318 RepID=A0A851GR76_9BACT|nr:4-hydroxy-3-methylbut-2-enyl diphosphate reductase [Oceaniferula marina]NWK57625.1 4-hydroxy-3-methylbut-2-enyl diphosphate reductase [Oceaniferula marina]